MRHLRFIACAIVFCTCMVKGNARIAYCHTANSVIYCDQLVVQADNFVENDTISIDSIEINPINLSDYLIEGETYRIKVTHYTGVDDYPLSYNIYATYACDLDLGSEDLELLDYIDYGSLVDENGNGLRNIAGSIPYNEDDIMGDYEQDEYAAMIYQYGLHFISNDVIDTRPITIEIYRLGEPDSPIDLQV